jgi:hypothetical protein
MNQNNFTSNQTNPQTNQGTMPGYPSAGNPQMMSQFIPQSPQADAAVPRQIVDPSSTQSTLLFSELRDGLIIMKDGSLRAVIACKSINFDLMSEQEREGVEYAYKGFINSLNFTTQILIRSQRIDIAPYIEKLTEIRKNNDNMLLGVLMDDYINFIDLLSQEANIMDKSFFIVVPYFINNDLEKASTQTKNIFSSFFGSKNANLITKIDRNTYDKATAEIDKRVETIISGLFSIGVNTVRLNTKELSELFYNFNNPDTAVREPFIDFNKLGTIYTKKTPSPYDQNPRPNPEAPRQFNPAMNQTPIQAPGQIQNPAPIQAPGQTQNPAPMQNPMQAPGHALSQNPAQAPVNPAPINPSSTNYPGNQAR